MGIFDDIFSKHHPGSTPWDDDDDDEWGGRQPSIASRPPLRCRRCNVLCQWHYAAHSVLCNLDGSIHDCVTVQPNEWDDVSNAPTV